MRLNEEKEGARRLEPSTLVVCVSAALCATVVKPRYENAAGFLSSDEELTQTEQEAVDNQTARSDYQLFFRHWLLLLASGGVARATR